MLEGGLHTLRSLWAKKIRCRSTGRLLIFILSLPYFQSLVRCLYAIHSRCAARSVASQRKDCMMQFIAKMIIKGKKYAVEIPDAWPDKSACL